ncbi:MAG TPA: 5-deoxy-glucuronate isomerase [Geminicoccaceae bacterium]|nr:5-deoxy-glucuronate isomerase [Geminicoccaceae bacterium]
MPELLLRPGAPDADGCVHRVTPASAGWRHVGFEVYRLGAGRSLARDDTGGAETCLVLLAGRADVEAGGESWTEIGERMSVFDDEPACSVYVPPRSSYAVSAITALELAVCRAPGVGKYPPRLIRPDEVAYSVRGRGTNTRHVYDILPETEPAESLLVVEVKTPGGCWSSYPPHKHDTDDLPHESQLEETYYHRMNPPQGFAFQRIYTDDGSLDEVVTIRDGDVTLVPRGYHPCGAAHGYDLYYLNVMAGPKRVWRFRTAPEHAWLLA